MVRCSIAEKRRNIAGSMWDGMKMTMRAGIVSVVWVERKAINGSTKNMCQGWLNVGKRSG